MARLLLTFIITLGCISTSLAHRVNVFCWVEGGKIYCTGKFASGTRVKNGQIKILAKKSGQVLAEGRTNDQGEFSLPVPRKAIKEKLDLEVELFAGMGHKNSWTIPADELTGDGISEDMETRDTVEDVQKAGSNPQAKVEASRSIDSASLEKVLNKVLDRKLKPVMEKLTLLQERPISFTDIFAGFGYILGLMGVGMYFKSKS